MGFPYTEKFNVFYNDTDMATELTPTGFAIMFQELAMHHSDELTYTLDWFAKEGKGWAILNWHVKIYKLPKYRDEVKITTWSSECRKMQAIRSFRAIDSQGVILAEAVSRWVYMDLVKRHPTRLPEGMEDAYVCNEQTPFENEKFRMPIERPEDFFMLRTFEVKRSDTDTNGHANNIKYIEWAMDDVPCDIFSGYNIKEFMTVYRKECYSGNLVVSKCYIKEAANGEKQIISVFSSKTQAPVVFCKIFSVWNPK